MSNEVWTGNQAAHVLKLVGDQQLNVAEAEQFNLYLPALLQAVKRNTLDDLPRFRRAIGCGVMRTSIPSISLPGDAAFRVSDRIVSRRNNEVKMWFVNERWFDLFDSITYPAAAPCDIAVDEVIETTCDKMILDELGADVCETSPSVLWFMLKNRKFSEGKNYLFYMKDRDLKRCVVVASWCEEGFRLEAFAVRNDLRRWHPGDLVVSLKLSTV